MSEQSQEMTDSMKCKEISVYFRLSTSKSIKLSLSAEQSV